MADCARTICRQHEYQVTKCLIHTWMTAAIGVVVADPFDQPL
jgi:hypothetical protein